MPVVIQTTAVNLNINPLFNTTSIPPGDTKVSNKKPLKLGAGCVAVTYLTTVNNEDIVIKIKRPNIEKKLETSFYIIYNLLNNLLPKGAARQWAGKMMYPDLRDVRNRLDDALRINIKI